MIRTRFSSLLSGVALWALAINGCGGTGSGLGQLDSGTGGGSGSADAPGAGGGTGGSSMGGAGGTGGAVATGGAGAGGAPAGDAPVATDAPAPGDAPLPTGCTTGAACTMGCMESCRGGSGSVTCTCTNGRLACTSCAIADAGPPDARGACPANAPGMDCPRNAVCSGGVDGGRGFCFCGDRDVWICPAGGTADAAPAACPANPAGMECRDRDQLCAPAPGTAASGVCYCSRDRNWVCP
jgi:hypothetical protein